MFMIQFSPMSLLRFAVVRSQAWRLGFMIFSTYLNTDKDCCAQKEMVWKVFRYISFQRRDPFFQLPCSGAPLGVLFWAFVLPLEHFLL